MRVVVGEVKRSVKREECRTELLLLGLTVGAFVRMGGTTGATKGSASSVPCTQQ